jgi:parallel beta-helix repeat protein
LNSIVVEWRREKMSGKVVSGMMLTLLLIGMSTLAFNVERVKASTTIYIRADGSIDPPTAPIYTADNVTYTFTGDINDSIVVERDNIVIDGQGHILQDSGSVVGIDLSSRINVTVKNLQIIGFIHSIRLDHSTNCLISGNNITKHNRAGVFLYSSSYNTISGNTIAAMRTHTAGVKLDSSSNNTISGNNITSNGIGIWLSDSSNNIVSENTITANNEDGLYLLAYLDTTAHNIIIENTITNNGDGVCLVDSHYNGIIENNIANNQRGVYLDESTGNTLIANDIANNSQYGITLTCSSINLIFHNNFVNNTSQVYDPSWDQPSISPSINIWDIGYPSGGNYWSDYNGTDLYSGPYQNGTGSDGIGDMPYIIDENNADRYPLMNPWILTTITGDINHDGTVNIYDIVSAASIYGCQEGELSWNPEADVAPPYGVIDIYDLVTIAYHYGKTV